jgi:hypothetical protein
MFRRKSRIAGVAAALLVAAAPAFLAQSGAQAGVSAPSRVSSSQASTSPSLALSDFASQIETLGVQTYPDSFAGAELTTAGVTNVYLTAPSNQTLVGAINALNVSKYPINLINVSRSYSQLDALNDQVDAASSRLKSEGISLFDSYPDPSSGTVVVDVLASSSATDTASGLKAEFGTDVTLGQEVASPMVVTGRKNDIAPYYGGDWINNRNLDYDCTGGFNVLNAENSPFMLTAGHCENGTYQTQAEVVGTTSTNWWSCGATVWDAQVITEASGLGKVWTDDGNTAPVVSWVVPAIGATLTWNGSVSGEKRGPVTKVDTIIYNIEDNLAGCTYNATHQVVSSGSLCVIGDSGGPVYQQYSGTPEVSAAGIITATQGTQACAATLIRNILIGKGLTLVTSSS